MVGPSVRTSRDKIVDVIRAVIFRRTCPHFEEGVILHVLAQLAVILAGDGLRLRIARTVHHDIEEVNAPIDRRRRQWLWS